MALTIPEAEQVQAVLTARINELIGTGHRDVAVAAADRAEAEADRAEAAADTVVTGVPDGSVTRPKLAPDVVAELEGKADAQVMNDVLENKSDTDHTHTSADITDTTSTVTESSVHGGKILRLGTQGKLFWNREPLVHNDLTNKAYVDQEVAKKADADHTHTAADVGARPDTWTPTASDVGARPDDWVPTAAEVGARPASWTPTAAEVGARPATWTPTAAQVGARSSTWMPTASQVGAATPAYVDGRIQLVTSFPTTGQPGVLYMTAEE